MALVDDWEAGVCSPLSNLMYIPLRQTCGRMLATADGGWYALTVRTEVTRRQGASRHHRGHLGRDR